jgi:hypothetical protein
VRKINEKTGMNDGQNFALVVMMLLISYNGRIDDGQV